MSPAPVPDRGTCPLRAIGMRELNGRRSPSRVRGRPALEKALRRVLLRTHRYARHRATSRRDLLWSARVIDGLDALLEDGEGRGANECDGCWRRDERASSTVGLIPMSFVSRASGTVPTVRPARGIAWPAGNTHSSPSAASPLLDVEFHYRSGGAGW